jgi:DNA-binding transcriptional regulator GbsR (MarR family)
LENDVLLKALHADERWKQVIKIVEENLEKLNEETNRKLKNDN